MKSATSTPWNTTRETASLSPEPTKRATITPMPEKTELMKTTITRKICQLTPIAALPL
jgi:hypothetical protein